jgi:hypothetical protein
MKGSITEDGDPPPYEEEPQSDDEAEAVAGRQDGDLKLTRG